MKIERFVSADILKPFVKTFIIIESENETESRILPDTSIVIPFRYKGSVTFAEQGIKSSFPVSVITGLGKSPRLLNYSKGTAILLVIFNEVGAAAFFNEPLHELFGKSVSLDNLIQPHRLDEIEERLNKAENNRQRISIIERFLISELKRTQSDPLILSAIQKIKSVGGNIRVKDLILNLPASRDSFEKRFRRVVGTSPKQFAAIVRLRSLIANYSTAESLTDAAQTAGYFDQAHFIKDFKSFTGQTPQAFFRSSARKANQ